MGDSCGIASGYANPASYATTPQGYQANTKGSEVLPERAATYWKAGGTAEVGWGLSAQHGGGYSYRLCPKGSTLNEECFQSNVLTLAKQEISGAGIRFQDAIATLARIVAARATSW